MLCAHRGASRENNPENTISAFKSSIKGGSKMIEFDVWLTKDHKLAVIHGGDNGELPAPLAGEEPATQHIFECSFDEI